ncbi:bifunctional glycosyltransferase family 2/GtrA family protein [Allofournierella sp.]|uniref:bifunctional glycosyltransferase family 2/GtrA family protein n=1 Tax=Allofournierella sp. TaxID=1940256 RepID=UPI0025C2B0E6|nr:bifunctional glycosyltransferase family 2/GtrA family protein [Fournierella sp.]
MKNKDVPIIIPSYEPDELLLDLCDRLTEADLTNVIVVDDGSGSSYQDIFEKIKAEYGFTVLIHKVNQGKGRALKTAFSHILEHQKEAIGCVTADSDGQHSPQDIVQCIEMLRKQPQALILGCRDFSGEDVPSKSRFGNELTRKIFTYLCGIKVSDTQTGLRGIPTEFMRHLLDVKGERFEFETRMLIECLNRVEIVEVPIQTIYDSKDDHKTHFNPILDSVRIYRIFGEIFLKYILSSLSSCVVDLVLFSIFCGVFKISMPHTYILWATVIARVISATYNCLVNYFLVFKSRQQNKSIRRSMVRYFCLAAIQMLASALFVTMISGLFLGAVSDTLIKAIVDVILFFVSYYLQRKFVF